MKVFATDRWRVPLPEGHRFPESKYRLLREAIEREGFLREGELAEPEAADDATLALAHDAGWVRRATTGRLTAGECRVLGFPWSPELVERSRRSVGATIAAARAASSEAGGVGASLAGGTHHGFRDRGEGFCVFNDVGVAIRLLQRDGAIRRALVVDLDVHQGNGTAAIFEGDEAVFTLSLHGARNYPLRKERSSLDVELPDGCEDAEYLAALDVALATAFAEARADFVFYVAGADPYAGDQLGRLGLTIAGLARRDERVLAECERLALPIAIVMGGGYAARVEDAVAIHLTTIRLATESSRRRERATAARRS